MIKQHIPTDDRRYMMDGTFDVAPLGSYYQLLIIYIEYKNDVGFYLKCYIIVKFMDIFVSSSGFFQVFPMFFVLMSGKKAKAYRNVFEYIEQHIFKLEPVQFITDFEAGMRKAIKFCYPSAILLGCWFHYCSAIRRRVLRLRLYRLIAENRNARSIYRKLLSWPLLPQNHMKEGYDIILKEADRNCLLSTFKNLFKYFDRYWLKQVFYHLQNSYVYYVFIGGEGVSQCLSVCLSFYI